MFILSKRRILKLFCVLVMLNCLPFLSSICLGEVLKKRPIFTDCAGKINLIPSGDAAPVNGNQDLKVRGAEWIQLGETFQLSLFKYKSEDEVLDSRQFASIRATDTKNANGSEAEGFKTVYSISAFDNSIEKYEAKYSLRREVISPYESLLTLLENGFRFVSHVTSEDLSADKRRILTKNEKLKITDDYFAETQTDCVSNFTSFDDLQKDTDSNLIDLINKGNKLFENVDKANSDLERCKAVSNIDCKGQEIAFAKSKETRDLEWPKLAMPKLFKYDQDELHKLPVYHGEEGSVSIGDGSSGSSARDLLCSLNVSCALWRATH